MQSPSRAWVLVGAAALCLALRSGGPSLADAEVGRALLQSAKSAHDKKQYDEALTLLGKAAREAPGVHEIAYWTGLCHDKKGDAVAAVRAWRELREAVAAAPADAPASKQDLELLKKAQARLLVLAPGEAEEEKVRKAFVADLLALAKAKEGAKDPASALLVLDALLGAEPRQPEAAAAAARLRTPPPRKGEFPLPPPLAALTTWKDLIASDWLGVSADWAIANHVLTLNIASQAVPGPPLPLVVGGRCALDMEVRLLTSLVPDWGVGFVLEAPTDRTFVGVRLGAKDVAAFKGGPTGGLLSLAEGAAGPIEPNTWHRLTVQVAAPKIVVWVDGKKSLQLAADGVVAGAQLRLFMNRCKVEMRTLRWAPLE